MSYTDTFPGCYFDRMRAYERKFTTWHSVLVGQCTTFPRGLSISEIQAAKHVAYGGVASLSSRGPTAGAPLERRPIPRLLHCWSRFPVRRLSLRIAFSLSSSACTAGRQGSKPSPGHFHKSTTNCQNISLEPVDIFISPSPSTVKGQRVWEVRRSSHWESDTHSTDRTVYAVRSE